MRDCPNPHGTSASLHDAARRFHRLAERLRRAGSCGAPGCTPELVEVLQLLAELPEWRVFVDGSAHFGHQASSIAMLQRLIQLTGFAKRVVVVYVDHGQEMLGDTAAKLALMFYDRSVRDLDASTARFGTCAQIRFLPYARRHRIESVGVFGFTGGADDLSENYAASLKVRFFVRLQPWLWDDPPDARRDTHYVCSRIEQPSGEHLNLGEAWPRLLDAPLSTPDTSEAFVGTAAASIEEGPEGGSNLARRIRNSESVWRAVRPRGDVPPTAGPLIWPLYGLQHFAERAAAIMLACALVAMRRASTLQRPIVVCLFGSHRELAKWSALLDELAPNGEGEQSSARHPLRAIAAGIPLHVHRARSPLTGDWADLAPSLDRALASPCRAAVHVVELGSVPMALFQWFMLAADLAPVIEGQATANHLAVHGRPFMQLLREARGERQRGVSIPAIRHAGVAGDCLLRLAALLDGRLDEDAETKARGADGQAVARCIDDVDGFLARAASPGSEVGTAFSNFGEESTRDVPDKLLVALLGLREVMLAGSPPSVVTRPLEGDRTEVRSTKVAS
jgi:hypothetical protein